MRQYKYTDNINIIQVCTIQACRDSTSIQTMQIQYRHDETVQVYRQYKHHTSMLNTGMMRQYKYTDNINIIQVCTIQACRDSTSIQTMQIQYRHAETVQVYRQYKHHTSMHNTGMQRQYKYTSGGSRKLRTGGGALDRIRY